MLISHQARATVRVWESPLGGCAAVLLTRVRGEHEGLGRTAAFLVREKLGNYRTHEVRSFSLVCL
jgi:hypothetical protein